MFSMNNLNFQKIKALGNKYILFTGILILIVLSIVLYKFFELDRSRKETGEGQLFSNYFRHYPAESDLSGYSQKDFAIKVYNQKDYKEAIVNFKYALVDLADDPEIRFYLGVSFLATSDAKEAIKQFEQVLNKDQSNFKDPARWYKALSYLKLNQIESSIEELNKINPGSEFYQESLNLLEELE